MFLKITEEKLRKIFQEKGTITDIQLKYTPEGKFREFAFVGYQNENEAEEAIKSFNDMFINTKKIQVESCALLGNHSFNLQLENHTNTEILSGDLKKPKAWSKYAPDSTAYKKSHPGLKHEETKVKLQKEKKNKKEDETIELLKKVFIVDLF